MLFHISKIKFGRQRPMDRTALVSLKGLDGHAKYGWLGMYVISIVGKKWDHRILDPLIFSGKIRKNRKS